MSQPASSPCRKRGGQPGNQNARKYGLYARVNPLPVTPRPPGAPLTPEILVLRAFINRVIAASSPSDSLAQSAAALRALVRASLLIARLLTAAPFIASPSTLQDELTAFAQLDPP